MLHNEIHNHITSFWKKVLGLGLRLGHIVWNSYVGTDMTGNVGSTVQSL